MIGYLLLLAIGLALLVAITTWWTAHRLRHPPRRTDAFAISRGIPGNPGEMPEPIAYESTMLDLTDAQGKQHQAPVWIIEGENAQGPILIASPGWGDSKIGLLPRLATLAPVCSTIIAWDSPGLGEAPSMCTLGVREPALLLDLARQTRATAATPRDVVLLGWSMGAGAAIAAGADAQSDDHIAAVIAESPYRRSWTPARNVMRNAGYPYRINVPLCFAALGIRLGVGMRWNSFDRAELSRRLKCPLLVVHGSEDDVCPIEDGRDIERGVSRSMLVVIEGAGHNNLWTDERFKPQSASAVRDFLLSLSAPSGPVTLTGNPASSIG